MVCLKYTLSPNNAQEGDYPNPEKLEKPYQTATRRVLHAINAHPEMIAGTGGFCTELMKHTHGKLIGKAGAEGVYCVGTRKKNLGIAIKIESGSMEVLPPVVMHVLKALDIVSGAELQNLSRYEIMTNLNDVMNIVGEIRPTFSLNNS